MNGIPVHAKPHRHPPSAARGRAQQRGAATLLVILVIMLVVTILALTSLRVSNVELRMASNDQERLAAGETAKAATDAVAADVTHFVVTGNIGYAICSSSVSAMYSNHTCNETTITLPSPPFTDETGVRIRRESNASPPPRSIATSADKYDVVTFDVFSHYKPTHSRSGEAHVREGVMVLVPKSNQSN